MKSLHFCYFFQVLAVEHRDVSFSLPAGMAGLQANDHRAALSSRRGVAAPQRDASTFDEDVSGPGLLYTEAIVAAEDAERVFFSVVKAEPGCWHTVKTHIATSRALRKRDIVISFHHMMPCSEPGQQALAMRGGTVRGLSCLLTGLDEADTKQSTQK